MIDTKKLREALNGYFVPPLRERTLELLDELDHVTAERDALRAENESLASNLRGKHSTAGATYAHLIAERDALKAERDALKVDAERFRWITDDHQDPRVRTDLLDLFDRLPVMSYSAACAAIDAAIRASKGEA